MCTTWGGTGRSKRRYESGVLFFYPLPYCTLLNKTMQPPLTQDPHSIIYLDFINSNITN